MQVRGTRFFSPGSSSGSTTISQGHALQAALRRPGRPGLIRKIAVIDDDPAILRMIKRCFRPFSDLEIALINPREKQQTAILAEAQEADLIIMDGNFNEALDAESGAALTGLLRSAGFAGYIAANSNLGETQGKIIVAGADFAIDKISLYLFISTKLFGSET